MSVAHFSEGAVVFSSLPPLFDSQKTNSLTDEKAARVRHQVLGNSCVPNFVSGMTASLITKNPFPFLVRLSTCFPTVLALQKSGGEFQVNTHTPGNQVVPSVSTLSNGNFVIAWVDQSGEDGSGAGVFGQIFNATALKLAMNFK